MTKRETGFLLIGLGAGLMLAAWVTIEFIFGHMFILGVQPAGYVILALPFVLLFSGVFLLYRSKRTAL